jgi:hypothetical protein
MTLPPSRTRSLGLLGATGFFLVILYLDLSTPWEVGFSAFYLLVVILATYAGGRTWGWIFGVLASVCIAGADFLEGKPYSHSLYRYWDALNHLVPNLLVPWFVDGRRRRA